LGSIRGLPKNVLVVDGDGNRCFNLAILVKRLEHNIFTAGNDFEFTRIMNGVLPHLVLLNIEAMPTVDGKNALEYIRSNPNFEMIKIVTVASKSKKTDLEATLKNGAEAMLTIPINPTGLFHVLEQLSEVKARKVPRIRVIFKVLIESSAGQKKTFITEFSEHGAFIRTMKPFPAGTKVRLTPDLPSDKPIALEGEVIYSRTNEKNRLIEPGMGIKFLNLNDKTRLGLRGFVESQINIDLDPTVVI